MQAKACLIGLAILAGCSSPQEACVARADQQYEGLEAAIAVAQANISRGFALEREVVARQGFVFCSGTGFGGTVRLGLSTCSGTRLQTIQTPVPLDIEAEERKLASMQARRPVARERRDIAAAACFS